MSDIYLQIAETPTVVTLSAPVISGALSSTVTVANTVTVALDANSLSALENVTVTVGNVTIGSAVTIAGFSPSSLPPSTVTVANTVTIAGTVTANVFNGIIGYVSAVLDGEGNTFGIDRDFPISGTVTANVANINVDEDGNLLVSLQPASSPYTQPISGTITVGNTVTIGSCVTHGVTIANTSVTVNGTFYQATQPVSLASVPTHGVTLASTTVTVSSLPALSAGTAQIGSVTASISGTVPVSGTFYQATQPVSLASVPTHGVTLASTTVTVSSLPALSAGTAQIGRVTASISGTVPVSISSVTVGNSVTIGSIPAISGTVTANTFAVQGTAVTTSNFTSTTASTVLANSNATRRVLTIFNEGAGNLHICAGATCTTVAYQVRLSAGDYYEVPNHQTTVTHSAVFATAGTARVTEVY